MEDLIRAYINDTQKLFYVCGPPKMMELIENQLVNLHVTEQSIIKEAF
jgi:ferredoxin-NADP reductase